MPDAFQSKVAKIALTAASGHGFALAGGQALIAHGIIARPTQDIDLFSDQPSSVKHAAALVSEALLEAGLNVAEVPSDSDLGEVFYGLDDNLTEFEVGSGDNTVLLQLVHYDRSQPPVQHDIGPVLHLNDVLATKVVALAARAYHRDFIDVGAALERFSREHLLALAHAADPALTDDEFADAMRRLDDYGDDAFRVYDRTQQQIDEMRKKFADWPRH